MGSEKEFILFMKNIVLRIVNTGGPCSGKSSGLAIIKQKLEGKGWIVLSVPEAATLCIEGGLSPIDPDIGEILGQKSIIRTIIGLENTWSIAAKELSKEKPVLIIHDRGITDCSAYMQKDTYRETLRGFGLSPEQVRDERYDAVIHMVTAAEGAEEFYTLENNTARYETSEEARDVDKRILDAWTGSPHLRAIDNSTDFKTKIQRVYQEICNVLGIPVPIECERKFLVTFHKHRIPDNSETIEIEQTYLTSPNKDEIHRVRKRGQNDFFNYYHTIKKETGVSGKRIEIEKMITETEYQMALNFKDPDRKTVKKKRLCFMHNYQYFELDVFESEAALMSRGDALLEIELSEINQEVTIPEWISIQKEVTDVPRFSNYEISTRV